MIHAEEVPDCPPFPQRLHLPLLVIPGIPQMSPMPGSCVLGFFLLFLVFTSTFLGALQCAHSFLVLMPPHMGHGSTLLPKQSGHGSTCVNFPSHCTVPLPSHTEHRRMPYPRHEGHCSSSRKCLLLLVKVYRSTKSSERSTDPSSSGAVPTRPRAIREALQARAATS